MSRWRWMLTQLTRRLWVRATLIGLLGVAAAICATIVERLPPWHVPADIGDDSVDNILHIIASSMLAVTTFSLSVMTAAYDSATNNVTPRATKLLMEDRVTQNVLSSFIGSFLFSIVGIVVLKTGAYGERGRFVLFVATIAVIVLVVVSLLRWIDHLTRLGRLGETSNRVEQAARNALTARLEEPFLGGVALHDIHRDIPMHALPLHARHIGYVQCIDMALLSQTCEKFGCLAYVTAIPGTFVYPDTPLVWFAPPPADPAKLQEAARNAFSLGDERSFDQDPRFGLVVMGEIGSRAVDDPGTVIDIIGRMARVLALWAERVDTLPPKPLYPRIHVRPLDIDDLFEDAFMLVARNGAGMLEIQLRLQKTLQALGRMGNERFRAAARHQATIALARAELALPLEQDKIRLRHSLGAQG